MSHFLISGLWGFVCGDLAEEGLDIGDAGQEVVEGKRMGFVDEAGAHVGIIAAEGIEELLRRQEGDVLREFQRVIDITGVIEALAMADDVHIEAGIGKDTGEIVGMGEFLDVVKMTRHARGSGCGLLIFLAQEEAFLEECAGRRDGMDGLAEIAIDSIAEERRTHLLHERRDGSRFKGFGHGEAADLYLDHGPGIGVGGGKECRIADIQYRGVFVVGNGQGFGAALRDVFVFGKDMNVGQAHGGEDGREFVAELTEEIVLALLAEMVYLGVAGAGGTRQVPDFEEIATVEGDIDILTETADDIPSFAERGATLEQHIRSWTGVEKRIEHSGDPPVFLGCGLVDILGRGDACYQGATFIVGIFNPFCHNYLPEFLRVWVMMFCIHTGASSRSLWN